MIPEHLSPHSINTYRQCPRRYLFNVRDPEHLDEQSTSLSPYAASGNALHMSLQAFYEKRSIPDVSGLIWDEENRRRYNEAVQGWIAMRSSIPDAVECERVIEMLFESTKLIGRVDVIKVDDRIFIGDHKTSKPGNPDDAIQGQIYMYIASHIYDRPIDCTFFYYRFNVEQRIRYNGDDYVEGIVSRVLSDIMQDKFRTNVGQHCSVCGYKHLCEAWS